MKRVLMIICSFFCFLTLVGCHSVSELSKANDELKAGNYTVYYQTQQNVTYGKRKLTDVKAEYLVKQNGNQKIMSTWDEEGTRYDVYTETLDTDVEVFTKKGNTWFYETTLPVEKYEEPEFLPEVEINKKNFSYEEEVWVGNTELINGLLAGKLKEKANQFESYKGFIDAEVSTVVNKYNVHLEQESISMIECEYQVLITFVDEKVLTLTETIVAEYSDVASTVLPRPNIFELSYAIKPTDNFVVSLENEFEPYDSYYEYVSPEYLPEDEIHTHEYENSKCECGAYIDEAVLAVDGNKILLSSPLDDSLMFYFESTEDGELFYVYENGKWSEMSFIIDINDVIDFAALCPDIEYTPEFFEYKDGKWVGISSKVNAESEEYLNLVEEMYEEILFSELNEDATVSLSIHEYSIEIVDNVISTVKTSVKIVIVDGENETEFLHTTTLNYSKVNKTTIETPEIK